LFSAATAGLRRVASALEAEDLVLAGIEAVMLALPELDADAMAKLARFADLEKGGDDWCNEPRLPAGQPGGGQWTTGGGGSATERPLHQPPPRQQRVRSVPRRGGTGDAIAAPRVRQSARPSATGRPSANLRATPLERSRPPDAAAMVVDASNAVAGTLVDAAHWL
jgi:hypothetical protein